VTTQENELESPAKKPEDAEAAEAPKNDAETATDKPEPDEEQKEEAAKMMAAYEDRPTLILPGTGGAVSGTAVNDWLDDDGNPKAAGDKDAPAAKANLDDGESSDEDGESCDGLSMEEQIEKDKAFNKAVVEAAEREDGVSEEEKAKAEREDKSVTR